MTAERRPPVRRRILAAAALSMVAGCTVSTDGTVVAAPDLGRFVPPLTTSQLSGLLLDPSDLESIMGAPLHVVESRDSMYRNEPLADGCLVWAEAQEHNYTGTDWSAIRLQELRDRDDDADHIVYQAVVSFPDVAGADQYYADQVTEWDRCDDQQVDLHDPGDPNAHYWSLSEATDNDGVLTLTRVQQESTGGWSCQRALTVGNNVIVEVSACAYRIADEAAEIAVQIAENIAQE